MLALSMDLSMNSANAIGEKTHSPSKDRAPSAWITFLAHFLIILCAWTLVIKYIVPIAHSAVFGLPLTTHIAWDLWPVAHVWLAWVLLRWKPYTAWLAILMSAVEIVIIVTLFYRFLSSPEPEWTIWRTNWFINKVFVLSCFILIFGTFALPRKKITIASIP
jgi:hypothetical protein